MEKTEILDHIVNETLDSFNELKSLKTSGKIEEIDYSYEVTRDRKAAIILKTILAEVHIENMKTNRVRLK